MSDPKPPAKPPEPSPESKPPRKKPDPIKRHIRAAAKRLKYV